MRTFVDLIDSMKPGVVAQAIGVSQKHVHTMRARNSIPPIYWGDLIAAAEKVGIEGLTYEKCRELRAEAPERRSGASDGMSQTVEASA